MDVLVRRRGRAREAGKGRHDCGTQVLHPGEGVSTSVVEPPSGVLTRHWNSLGASSLPHLAGGMSCGPSARGGSTMSLGLLLLPVCVAQPADLPPVVPTLGRTMTFYYQKPDPEVGPKLLAELLKKENIEHPWFEKRGDVLRLIAAQLGDIGRGKPEVLRKYEAAFAGAPKAGRLVIARAL